VHGHWSRPSAYKTPDQSGDEFGYKNEEKLFRTKRSGNNRLFVKTMAECFSLHSTEMHLQVKFTAGRYNYAQVYFASLVATRSTLMIDYGVSNVSLGPAE
jgi:hypothetical protein